MEKETIIDQIQQLAKKHNKSKSDVDEWAFTELYESQACDLVIDYCTKKGFVEELTEKLTQHDGSGKSINISGDYLFFNLVLNYSEASDLGWIYTSLFWPDQFESKEDWLETARYLSNPELYFDDSF